MENFKQKFIDTAYSKFGVKANGKINFEQAFAIIDEIEQCHIADVVGRSEQVAVDCIHCGRKYKDAMCKLHPAKCLKS